MLNQYDSCIKDFMIFRVKFEYNLKYLFRNNVKVLRGMMRVPKLNQLVDTDCSCCL